MFEPLPVRERMIPKPGGSEGHATGIPTGGSAASSSDDLGFVVITHPFHPLTGQRLEVPIKRRVDAVLFVSAGCLG